MIQKVINTLIATNSVSATYFESDKKIIRATRKRYNGKFNKKQVEVTLTIGRPNYKERDFIKACKKSGEPFPVKKIQLKPLPKKK